MLAVTGLVEPRTEGTRNPKMETGEIEVMAGELKLLNESKVPPFFPGDANVTLNEEVRLKYRYLDLRRPEMHANIEMRHRVTLAIRNYLAGEGFYEIETPYMTRSTPEGARDYLVPSRVHPGEFYALPQSPQIFKQLLMIGGLDRYFQIARCFRDEDLRADRQPEFTQIDLELTFPTEETIHGVVEGFLDAAFTAAGYTIERPFPQMAYDEAIRLYGIDKPDLRLPRDDRRKGAAAGRRDGDAADRSVAARGGDPHPEGGRAFAQRARRAQGAAERKAVARSSSSSTTSSGWKRPGRRPLPRFAS